LIGIEGGRGIARAGRDRVADHPALLVVVGADLAARGQGVPLPDALAASTLLAPGEILVRHHLRESLRRQWHRILLCDGHVSRLHVAQSRCRFSGNADGGSDGLLPRAVNSVEGVISRSRISSASETTWIADMRSKMLPSYFSIGRQF
jgi:hypothetical protein